MKGLALITLALVLIAVTASESQSESMQQDMARQSFLKIGRKVRAAIFAMPDLNAVRAKSKELNNLYGKGGYYN